MCYMCREAWSTVQRQLAVKQSHLLMRQSTDAQNAVIAWSECGPFALHKSIFWGETQAGRKFCLCTVSAGKVMSAWSVPSKVQFQVVRCSFSWLPLQTEAPIMMPGSVYSLFSLVSGCCCNWRADQFMFCVTMRSCYCRATKSTVTTRNGFCCCGSPLYLRLFCPDSIICEQRSWNLYTSELFAGQCKWDTLWT